MFTWSRRTIGAVSLMPGVLALSIAGSAVRAAPSGVVDAVGVFDGHMDVGAPRIAGSTLYNAVSQEYTLSAGGVNMWATRDEFQFAWKRMTGDFILQARVEFLGTGVDPHRKAGWIVRRQRRIPTPPTWTAWCTATA